MPLSIAEFFDRLRESGVLAPTDVDALWKRIPQDKREGAAERLTQKLVESGKLTQHQAAALLEGRGHTLVLGDYVVLQKIGAGGMGQVFKALHRRMKRTVAIKVLPPAVTSNPESIKRFQREVEAAARLTHPNIVAAHDAGEQKGIHYLVIEYVAGDDLANVVKKYGPLSVDLALSYISQAANGLAHAHKQGVIHRDIKPANLLVDSEGIVKILDMGLARFDSQIIDDSGAGLTQSGTIMGTVDYMSPEQALDTKTADARSDVYSLGCTLFFLLTGGKMYDYDTVMKGLVAHRELPIPSLADHRRAIPPGLSTIFARMVAKLPGHRFQSMTEVRDTLDSCRQAFVAELVYLSSSSGGGSSLVLSPESQIPSIPSRLTSAVPLPAAVPRVMVDSPAQMPTGVPSGATFAGKAVFPIEPRVQRPSAQRVPRASHGFPRKHMLLCGSGAFVATTVFLGWIYLFGRLGSWIAVPKVEPAVATSNHQASTVAPAPAPVLRGVAPNAPGGLPSKKSPPTETKPAESTVPVEATPGEPKPVEPSPAKPKPTVPPVAKPGPSVVVGRFISDQQQIFARYDAKAEDWLRLAKDASLNAGDRLLVLPTYRPQMVLLHSGVQLTVTGESLLELLPPDDKGVSCLKVEYGRLTIVTSGKPGTQIGLDLGKRQGVVSFDNADSVLAVEVRRFRYPGDSPEKVAPTLVSQIFPAGGSISWVEIAGESVKLASGQTRTYENDKTGTNSDRSDLPDWVTGKGQHPVDRMASQGLAEKIPSDRSLFLSLVERLEQSKEAKIEVRSLAIRCLMSLNEYEPFIAALSDDKFKSYWSAQFDTAQESLARGPEAVAEMRKALETLRAKDSATLYRVLLGYSPEELARSGADTLIEYLGHESLDFRVLASETLVRITGLTLSYRPENTLPRRAPSVQRWRQNKTAGTLIYKVIPSPLAE